MEFQVIYRSNNRATNAHHQVQTSTADSFGLTAAVDLFDEVELFDTLDNERILELTNLGENGFSSVRAIRKSTGISVRRILREGVKPLDLAERLIKKLELSSNSTVHEFDHILLCHSHVDPGQSVLLADTMSRQMAIPRERITPGNLGCAGFLKMLTEASLFLVGKPVGAKVAILSVETPEFWHDASDRLFSGIVSAGATAVALEVGHGMPLGIVRSDDFSIPAERRPNPDPLFERDETSVWDFRGQPCHRTVMRMNPEPVFLNGIELMLNNLRSALSSLGASGSQKSERIIVAPHQPSAKLLKALRAAAVTEFPNIEFLNNLDQYGNTISSSVPTLLSRIHEVIAANNMSPVQKGDQIVLLAAGICMREIGNHMSAGHACLTWNDAAERPTVETSPAQAVSSSS